MTYRAPINDMLLSLNHGAGLKAAVEAGHYGDFDADIAAAVLEEAGKFATDVLAPLNKVGDEHGIKLDDGKVTTAPGWPDAYKRWTEGGWNAVSGPEDFGGQGLPIAINAACTEIWSAANVAFGLCPLLTASAIEALDAHGSDELKKIYLEKLVSGEWTGTMQLTEPQAGSDVGALRTRAEKQADGTYRIKGTKIFITYGEHDMTDNIVHFVLARLPDAPAGTKGISLFLVPKFMVNADGSLGARNDIFASGVEHKLGMHASPTCTMTMGDHGGAIGFLIGEENQGMRCMFTMMNQARLGVGLEGVGVADRAYQQALSYAQERKQGRAVGSKTDGSDAIFVHPDVKRMLMRMRAQTAAARTICYATAVAIDVSTRAKDPKVRTEAAARAALLTPMAKAYSTDIGNEVAYLGVQIHGGMGFIEETGAAQHYRDARITAIYEGTNGIQAIDLVTRKLAANGGASVWALLDELAATVKKVEASNDPAFGTTGAKLREALEALTRTSKWLLERVTSAPNDALAGATPYLQQFGATLGGCLLASEALAAKADGNTDAARYVSLARFFAENITVQAGALERTVTESAESVAAADAVLLG
ncbi:acyl-CoA dehydrogenase [Bradyrhizobium sp. WBOS7]|uniref:3-methylmercaptopropionyl-CoA dehydrogenase n=1 Tax=Bradyrhizobium betae TaxID=244734 RepID=A0AAE9NC50_9BRAD|nr:MULTISPECIES: acyl-CoA dehydrogenase [Bradyrhizobium]MDD1569835.1 acyl-CoA dehydrogenase [Bradyrhizobium sp. WBOS1]UUO35697.1 acyl-CoA dehydrogenase [Bradyrhizobium sp. WBOS01]MDD1526524.1 acyl-CoA dehydrogenase [Bradyrhizobium sp. WBOS2]MDD1575934.1 acyl-CoA dehydrogenase [Bradyrhizobium sp. WBOS7]MDD1599477.1 acyl-CoA dehydrogenase [Bradyrhizobium sp. WBOS16]